MPRRRTSRRMFALAAALVAPLLGCARLAANFAPTRALPHKIVDPVRPEARLAVLWIGHATVLLQMDDQFILTDPVFTSTVGILSKRLVEPGIDPEHLPGIDAVVISHMHFDHLSYGSIDMIAHKTRQIVAPAGSRAYIPDSATPLAELASWQSWRGRDGLTITSVPVRHVGWRYGADASWMTSFSGYVAQYHGLTVYFGGDTAYDEASFTATAARFPEIDLALMPIAPIRPRSFMHETHVDPYEAARAFLDLNAKRMVPIHFDTFINSLDDVGDAPRTLARVRDALNMTDDQITILQIGEQRVLIRR
jgi:N-acyl-phosphatidylethanolamine-hydrolysing phospholipase D